MLVVFGMMRMGGREWFVPLRQGLKVLVPLRTILWLFHALHPSPFDSRGNGLWGTAI